MSEEKDIPQRPANAIAVLASRKEVEDVEAALSTAFREAWPDWVFDRAIRTDLEGPQGEPYVRLDRITHHALGLADEDPEDESKRRGPPTHARVPSKVRDMIEGKVQEMPEAWRDEDI